MIKNPSVTHDFLETIYNPKTIRTQAQRILNRTEQHQSEHFILDRRYMTATVTFVMDVIKEQYPDYNIPFHSRWRHFETGAFDRIALLRNRVPEYSAKAFNKIRYELVIISVLLDAGAGAHWHYYDKNTNTTYSRSEGLALASLELYQMGALSNDPKDPLRVDAQALGNFNESILRDIFQVSEHNPLEGITGRVTLLNHLGMALEKNQVYFGTEARLGNFYSYINTLKQGNTLSAVTLFQAVLQAFNSIWPNRLSIDGIPLGDVWIHKALKTEHFGDEYIPFHKLSQWLTYSLLEPLLPDIEIRDLEALTGLPEYRNGGLFIDTQLLQIKNKDLLMHAQTPGSEAIIEWRALTIALLDELAEHIRKELNLDAQHLPLAKILQGGTWDAGRRIARIKRANGVPPIQIISDGTIF